MAASELIAAGSTAESSAEFAVVTGEVVPICVKGAQPRTMAGRELNLERGQNALDG